MPKKKRSVSVGIPLVTTSAPASGALREASFSTSDPSVVAKLSARSIYPVTGTGTPMVHGYAVDDTARIHAILNAS